MITETQYEEALKVVLAYKKQLEEKVDYIEDVTTKYAEYRELLIMDELGMRIYNCLRISELIPFHDAKIKDLKNIDVRGLNWVRNLGESSIKNIKKAMIKAGYIIEK